MEKVLNEYGNVVRIAPNELVFVTPKAFHDIYTSHEKMHETFVKTDFHDSIEDGGILWEQDPVKHRRTLKQLAPAFSTRSLRKLEPTIHKYVNLFVEKMKSNGGSAAGVNIVDWTNWLAMNTSADLAFCMDTEELKNEKPGLFLRVLIGFNKFFTVMQVFKRFPLIKPLQYFFLPIGHLRSFAELHHVGKATVDGRIERRGATSHPDFFEQVLPSDAEPPVENSSEYNRIGHVGIELMFAGFQPISDWYYATLVYLLKEPEAYATLVAEIRNALLNYEDIVPEALATLPYLNACLEESLRLFPGNNNGLPRFSPGAIVDGNYIPKGIVHSEDSLDF
ncbi:hypothetical protein SLS53_007157 [Cytospora paraplurivora]|uniref:Cytochrome P450 n=1 Tax=Cytospora paraplurivora TaxID=2898453 RepID=A0AAN9U9I7_9PEZI